MEIFIDLLTKNESLMKISKTEAENRRKIIFDQLFTVIYKKVSNSLLEKDRIIFALKLVQIKLGKEYVETFTHLIRSSSILESSLSPHLLGGKLQKKQLFVLQDLLKLNEFAHLE